ncbi:unnamed protein product, partial [Rotaria sordida]
THYSNYEELGDFSNLILRKETANILLLLFSHSIH